LTSVDVEQRNHDVLACAYRPTPKVLRPEYPLRTTSTLLEVKGELVGEIERGRPRKELSVGETARRSGVAVSTLHFYESKGLIRSSRTRGNQRRFQREVLRRIAIIKVGQKAGIPLVTIQKALASLPDHRVPALADWRKLSTAWKLELDNRIRKLTQLRDRLSDCIGCGCLSIKVCPLRNPMDELATEGSGPRLLERGGSS
jgi:MerR family transcriptional regulator, redox-sensitive transcriptional activator SoxR